MPTLTRETAQSTRPFAVPLRALCTRQGLSIRLTSHGVRALQSVRSPRDARHVAGLSLKQMADVVFGVTGHRYTTGALANLEAPKRRIRECVFRADADQFKMRGDVLSAYVDTFRAAVRLATARALDVRVTVTAGRWVVEPVIRCCICDDSFTPSRAGVTRCPWCIAHRQTKRRWQEAIGL